MAPSMLTRRALLGVVVAGVLLGACDADRSDEAAGADTSGPTATDSPLTTDDPAANQPTSGSQQCSGADASPVSPAPEATVTFGPINGVGETTTADGEPLIILGTVYSQDCEPLADATLTMYQTDGNGEYGPGHGTDDMRCCYLGGSVVTDANGHFQVTTVRPAHYRGEANPPPAHIHLEVRHPNAAPLASEIVFADDDVLPANADSLGLIVTDPVRDGNGWLAFADIVLADSSGGQG